MRLNHQPRPRQRRDSLRRPRSHRTRRLLLVAGYTVVIFGAGALASGYVDRLGLSFARVKQAIASVETRLRATLSDQPDVPHLFIDIKFKQYLKMARQREAALARFHLEVGEDDYVPATFRLGDRVTKARVRLKGDWIDHFDSNKWSLRVKVRGDETLLGMKRFSIQHPKTRNYMYEWMYHRALRREDVLAVRYDFIEVTLNGDKHGLYAMEEHFEKRLIEYNRRPEGPIVRFDENLMFQMQIRHRPFRESIAGRRVENTADSNTVDPYLSAEIDTFQTNRMRSDPELFAQHTAAIHLLEAFRRGERSTSEVFDVGRMATYLAVSDLLGASHASEWRNVRFYYNPITSLLEPIGFDGDAGRLRHLSCVVDTGFENRAAIGEGRALFAHRIFSDLDFFEEYVRVLDRISNPEYLDDWFAEIGAEVNATRNLLRSEFPRFEFSERIVYRNQQYIRNALNPVTAMHAYYRGSTAGQIVLELGNIQSLPVEVLGLVHGDSPLDSTSMTILPAAVLHPPRPVEYHVTRFAIPDGFDRADSTAGELKVRYRILGTNEIRERSVVLWPHSDDGLANRDIVRSEANWQTFDFLDGDESTREIFIRPGNWSIDRDLVIPEGYRVIAGEGTRLDLSGSANILSYSPLQFAGTEANPIVIKSEDGTGQGVVVINARRRSILDHVAFQNLSSAATDAWKLTGAVTFYDSPVNISNARFIANRSEDALHIVRSAFQIENSVFGETYSDAFDSDFSEGSIRGCRFVDSGNDAIDVSGSVVTIENLVVEGSGDKAISAGERSQVDAADLEIRGAEIALASKDSSTVTVTGMRVSDGQIGLAAFQKKSEFGPASMSIHQLRMQEVATPFLVETGSSVIVDGRSIEATKVDLRSVLYEAE